RRAGLVHGLLNTTATALYVGSLLLRRRGARATGQGLSGAGFLVAIAAAYLGGHLVYGKRIGVDRAPRPAPWDDFVPVLPEPELREGTPRRVQAKDTAIVLLRRAGRVHALVETCAHLGGPLAEGTVEDDSIRCPWHGSRFALEDGRVLEGPSTFPQPCFEARIRTGQIEVRARTS
ncbi:MAG: Rieske 2Fe-2S domain-containing protein, partial [Candidatus Rokuibacteriota bacterium]